MLPNEMMAGVTIRQGRRDDLVQVISLLGILYKGDVGESLADMMQEYLESLSHLVLVAIAQERPVGVLVGSYRLDIDYECRAGLVDAIVVEESQRKKGIGRALVREFAEWAGQRGCTVLQVINPNQGFFEEFGFKEREMRFWQMPAAETET